MPTSYPERQAQLRALIQTFLTERLDGKLEALKPDDPKRAELQTQFAWRTWIDDAARRSAQIQCATHTLKPIHPDARGTSLYVAPQDLPALDEVGSHCLGSVYADDVVGNAAALDVFKFLKLAHEGRTLLQLACAQDADLAQALSTEPAEAHQWMAAFAALVQPRGAPATHGYAKQLYWRVEDDAHNDASYHLIAPLFGSALAHTVWQTLQEHRFGDSAKAARQARKDGTDSETPVYEYPHLAVRKMGGTKPQNISQLNSERRGMNYLLSSLPPKWKVNAQRFPTHADSVFTRYFDSRPLVRQTVKTLRRYLESNPNPVKDTRDHRKELVDMLVDEMVNMAAELQHALPPGWTLDDPRFSALNEDEQTWLDALRAELPEEDDFANRWLAMEWPDAIGTRFGNWLNARLEGKLSFSDIEFRAWKKELLTDEDGFSQQLRERRKRIRAARKGGQP